MSDKPKYLGDWVVSQLLDGTACSHREQVEAVAAHIGTSMEDDNEQYVNRFKVESSSSSSTYLVSQRRKDGMWCCSCRGWTMHVDAQGRRKCKHLTDILARLAAVDTITVTPAQASSGADLLDMLASARAEVAARRI
jgi:hypothetical protein